MNDAVDRVIVERQRMDRGFSRSLWLSLAGHGVLVVIAVAAPLLAPAKPLLRVAEGIIVPLPPGGGGPSQVGPPATAPAAKPKPEPTAPPAPPKPDPKQIVKPPAATQPPAKEGLPDPDAKRRRPAPKATPTPVRAQPGASGSTGTAATTPGLDLTGPVGPGVPGGTDPGGDWYLAGVQRKIWTLWNQQIRTGPQLVVAVSFTILADGSVSDVRIVQSSGVYLYDQAAQRAIYSSAPFAPLPEHYGTDRFTLTAEFKPLG